MVKTRVGQQFLEIAINAPWLSTQVYVHLTKGGENLKELALQGTIRGFMKREPANFMS
jgi:hypothetical protein